ncbi:hypothetical protein L506_1058 [Bordetella bronchiseptica GA96-01]|nr:hypothetical protein L506_1058 [Bordetella bronchiseptica GA96-01]
MMIFMLPLLRRLPAPAGPPMAVPERRSNICSFSIYHRKERIKPVSGRR